MSSVARADLRVQAPDDAPAWALPPHVMGRLRQGLGAVGGKVLRRSAARGAAVFTAQVDAMPLTVVCAYAPADACLVVRLECESPFPARLAAMVFPTGLLVCLLASWVLFGTAVGIAAGFVVGLALSTVVSWWTWRAARERGTEGPGRHTATMHELRSAVLRSLRSAGFVVEENPSRLLGIEESGVRASAGESPEEALRMGDPDAWTRRMREALEALP